LRYIWDKRLRSNPKYYFLFLLFISSCLLRAQVDSPLPAPSADDDAPLKKQYYVFSPRVSVTVPHPMANNAFKKCFVGVYEVSGGINVMLFRGLFVGGTYKNGLLKIKENRVADYNARLAFNNAGLKVGGDVFVGDKNKMIFSAALTMGQNWSRYNGQSAKYPDKTFRTSYSCSYAEPELNLFFLVEANFGIGATLTYSVFNKNFDPYEYTLDNYANFDYYKPAVTGYLSFGFGFYYSLLKKKQKA
jgi:hypothetical protein